MPTRNRVAILATLDTKEVEARFLAAKVRACGLRASLVDLSLRNTESHTRPATRKTVVTEPTRSAREPGNVLADAIERKGLETRQTLNRLSEAGHLDAVVAIGGGKGTVMACIAMGELPYETPKVMVSSARPDVFGRVTGTSNTVIFPAVVDINGLNRFTKLLLGQAALAVSSMARAKMGPSSRQAVAITAFGVTTPAVTACRLHLESSGFESIVFAATGNGGLAMERFVREGVFKVVLDLTTTELADELLGGFGSAGPHRLETAGQLGVPQIVAPGGMDMVNFGPPNTVPPRFRRRLLFFHSPQTTLVRTTPGENERLGWIVGQKLRKATGPVSVLVPLRGFSAYDSEGGPFHDPAATSAWVKGLERSLKHSAVKRDFLDCHINDPAFSKRASDLAVSYLSSV
jgi:uncharacterized protein (UPF0261 family)